MRETTTSLTDRTPGQQTQVDDFSAKQKNDSVDDLTRKLGDFDDIITKVKRTFDYQENQTRRCNLRFDGTPDAENEMWEQTEKNMRWTMTTSLELPEPQVAQTALAAPGWKLGPSWPNLRTTKNTSSCLRRQRRNGLAAFTLTKTSQRIMARRKELLPAPWLGEGLSMLLPHLPILRYPLPGGTLPVVV